MLNRLEKQLTMTRIFNMLDIVIASGHHFVYKLMHVFNQLVRCFDKT